MESAAISPLDDGRRHREVAVRLFDAVGRPQPKTAHRALRLGDRDDLALLEAVSRGEFATAGFRNRDVRALIRFTARRCVSSRPPLRRREDEPSTATPRVHSVIQKIPKTPRYRLTANGQLLTAALFARAHS